MRMPQLINPVGPLFGPNFQEFPKSDAATTPEAQGSSTVKSLQVYPDALNPQLREAGLPMHYYYQPPALRLAHREGADGYDFSVYLFKGLMSKENSIITDDNVAIVETGGGW